MSKERIGEQVFVFISDEYAQVTATVILTARGSIVVDTLLFPGEAEEVRSFATRGGRPISYLMNTHGHLDHVCCNYLYPDVEVIAHPGVRQAMLGELRASLAQAATSIPELREARLRPPTMTTATELMVRHGGLTLRLIPLPGHSDDALGVYVEEERILVAGDAVLPVPHFVGGDPDVLARSLQRIRGLSLNTIVQGHGDVILKGEVKEAIDHRLRYIRQVKRLVGDALARGLPLERVQESDIEAFGGSRLDLDGLTQQLHEDNLAYLYQFLQEGAAAKAKATRTI